MFAHTGDLEFGLQQIIQKKMQSRVIQFQQDGFFCADCSEVLNGTGLRCMDTSRPATVVDMEGIQDWSHRVIGKARGFGSEVG